MFQRLLPAVLVLCSLAMPAYAQMVVVGGPGPGPARVESLLQFAGFTYRRLAPNGVMAQALTGARLAVLIQAPLSPAANVALTRFAAEGGRLVLINQEASPELYRAVGVEAAPAAPATRYERISAVPGEAVPGLPAEVRDVVSPTVVLTPLDGTRVVARRAPAEEGPGHGLTGTNVGPPHPRPLSINGGWRGEKDSHPQTIPPLHPPLMERGPGGEAPQRPAPPAITLAAGGAAIAGLLAPGDLWEKSWVLQAVLAAVDPSLAETATQGLRRQAADALAAAAAHWARVRDRAALSSQERQDRYRTLQVLRAEWDGVKMGTEGLTHQPGGAMSEAAPLQALIRRVRAFDLGLTPSPAGEIRGIWIHTYAPTDWDRVARQVKAAGLNSLFVRVGRGGNLIYPSALLPRDAWAEKAGGDELKRAIDAAHRQGLQFYAWRVNFHMGSAPKEYRDRMAAEDRLVRDSHGAQANWANPGDPRNTELEFQVMREMVEKYDVDGIQFDYIRYPDAPSFDFDYGPVSRREFERKLGYLVAHWPADVLAGPLKSPYEDWERENVNHLVERVYHEVKRLKPTVQVTAAVWRNHRRYRAVLKQDWPLWVERGWLDFVVPMDYTPEPDTFAATVDAQVSLTRGRVPLAAGIGNWLLQTPEELVRQVEIAREAGAGGFVLFAYNAEQIEEQLAALRLGATARDTMPALPPPGMSVSLASPAVAPKDAPMALTAGAALRVQVTLAPESQAGSLTEPSPITSSSLCLERPTGELIQLLGRITGEKSVVLAGVTPSGRFQPVVRGTMQRSGRPAPFIVRGPLVEGLRAEEIAALRAQEQPPVFPGGSGVRVGVYTGGLGSETVLGALSAQQGVRAAAVHHLRPEHLAAVDTLLLPQLSDVAELETPTQALLRRWVEGGGTLILTHDAIGARWHPRLFPELVRDVELAPASTLVTAAAIEPMPASTRFRPAGVDQFRITPGPAARVLVRENPGIGDGPSAALGAPVVVAGRVGQGTVVLVGFLSGYQQREIVADEAGLLAALARYRAVPARAGS